MISLIAAMSLNRVIGKGNTLPWSYPEDLAYFKKTTTGSTIVMGRKTYESIGRPLPKRTNIVLTTNTQRSAPGVIISHDLDAVIEMAKKSEEEIFIIGGAAIYQALLPYADKVYMTLINKEVDGDTYFPPFEQGCTLISETQGESSDLLFRVYKTIGK